MGMKTNVIDSTFQDTILFSPLYSNPFQTAIELATQLDFILTELLNNNQIPLKTKAVTARPPQPWFNSDIAYATEASLALFSIAIYLIADFSGVNVKLFLN